MIKKIITILILLLIIVSAGWIYCANEFAKSVKRDTLPQLKEKNIISLGDNSKIRIKKYMFNLYLSDITFFPKSKIGKFHLDKVRACYNPISKDIKLETAGNKLTLTNNNFSAYVPTPNYIVKFNRSLLENDFESFDISIFTKNSSMYFSDDNKFISKSKSSTITISNKPDGSLYEIDLKLNMKGAQFDSDTKLWLKHLGDKKLIKILNEAKSNRAYESLPIDYSTKYSVLIDKDYIRKLVTKLKEGSSLDEIFVSAINNFPFKDKIYEIKVAESAKNESLDYSFFSLLSNDGNKINAKLKLDADYDSTPEQIASYIDIYKAIYLYMTEDNHVLKEKTDTVSRDQSILDDFTLVAKMVADVKKLKTDINIEYALKSEDIDYKADLKINDFGIDLVGAFKDGSLDTDLKLLSPKVIIEKVVSLYRVAVRPILLKSLDKNDNDIKWYDKMSENLENNGLEALISLSDSKDSEANDTLSMKVVIDPSNFEFKINNKNFAKIITDEKMIKFMKNIPQEDTMEKE